MSRRAVNVTTRLWAVQRSILRTSAPRWKSDR